MVIVLKQGATKAQIDSLCTSIERFGVKASVIIGAETSIIGLVGNTSALDQDTILLNPFVDKVVKIQEPYKHVNRKMRPDDSIIKIGNIEIGGDKIVIMAGPCSVEGRDQIIGIAKEVYSQGATILRGGAFKPRSSPYSFQGLKAEGLDLLAEAREVTGMPIVTEITDPNHIEMFMDKCDCFQVGARNMQNFELLKQLGQIDKPILLKRGFANTIEEFLMSAEYICAGGNMDVILCERGIRTYETYTRNTLDISAVPILKKISHLPVVVDPSHAAGIHWMVEPLAMASIAAGADGLIIEVHNDPANAMSDGAQSLTYKSFEETMGKIKKITEAMGRSI